MSLINKILLPALATVSIFALSQEASAARVVEEESSTPGAILFRIENIKPIADKDGMVEKCSFMLTAYNRMDKGVKEAILNLNWVDNISNKYSINNEQVVINSNKDSIAPIKTTMTLKSIASHTQKSFEGVVNTDKCYVLFDNVDYSVESCINDGDKIEMKDSRIVNRSAGCSGNFNYINSKNPEYYSEFKDVPDSVLQKQTEAEKANELAKISNNYRGTMTELETISKTLSEIK